jgi:hypothetical protein
MQKIEKKKIKNIPKERMDFEKNLNSTLTTLHKLNRSIQL